MKWNSVELVDPPVGVFVHTKIKGKEGDRNLQNMKFEKNLWWDKDGMYVYYTPTHWSHIEKRVCFNN